MATRGRYPAQWSQHRSALPEFQITQPEDHCNDQTQDTSTLVVSLTGTRGSSSAAFRGTGHQDPCVHCKNKVGPSVLTPPCPTGESLRLAVTWLPLNPRRKVKLLFLLLSVVFVAAPKSSVLSRACPEWLSRCSAAELPHVKDCHHCLCSFSWTEKETIKEPPVSFVITRWEGN